MRENWESKITVTVLSVCLDRIRWRTHRSHTTRTESIDGEWVRGIKSRILKVVKASLLSPRMDRTEWWVWERMSDLCNVLLSGEGGGGSINIVEELHKDRALVGVPIGLYNTLLLLFNALRSLIQTVWIVLLLYRCIHILIAASECLAVLTFPDDENLVNTTTGKVRIIFHFESRENHWKGEHLLLWMLWKLKSPGYFGWISGILDFRVWRFSGHSWSSFW